MLPSIAFRCGVIAGILAKAVYPKVYGVQITASHNPIQDNGIKLINEHGETVAIELEKFCEEL
jgi:phosphoacetylglucosamine mutase